MAFQKKIGLTALVLGLSAGCVLEDQKISDYNTSGRESGRSSDSRAGETFERVGGDNYLPANLFLPRNAGDNSLVNDYDGGVDGGHIDDNLADANGYPSNDAGHPEYDAGNGFDAGNSADSGVSLDGGSGGDGSVNDYDWVYEYSDWVLSNAEQDGDPLIRKRCLDRDHDHITGDPNCSHIVDCNDDDPTAYQEQTYYPDNDGDGIGIGSPTTACMGDIIPEGFSDSGKDCDDYNPNIFCGITDYADNDHDGYGNGDEIYVCSDSCTNPSAVGRAANNIDCNDNDSEISPRGIEICNNKDDNCNGLIDEGIECEKIAYTRVLQDGIGVVNPLGTWSTHYTPQKINGYAKWSLDNQRLLYLKYDSSTHKLRIASSRADFLEHQDLTSEHRSISDFALSSNNLLAYLASETDSTHHNLFIKDLDSGIEIQLTSHTTRVEDPFHLNWSKDENMLAYDYERERTPNGNESIAIFDTRTGLETIIENAHSPSWDPLNNNKIAYIEEAYENVILTIRDLATDWNTQCLNELRNGLTIGGISWSRDGDWIAYHEEQHLNSGDSPYSINIVRPDGSGRHELTENELDHIFVPSFSWSPDSKKIAYSYGTQDRQQIYTLDINTREIRLITPNQEDSYVLPNWTN